MLVSCENMPHIGQIDNACGKNVTWNTIRPSFLYFMNDCSGEVKGVEVGVNEGKNAEMMLSTLKTLHLTLVDYIHFPSIDKVVKKYKDRTKHIVNFSVETAKTFSDEYFDYVYIDANHDKNSVMEDLTAWYPKCKKGGIFAGHDWWLQDVKDAVFEFLKDKSDCIFAMSAYTKGNLPVTVSNIDAEMMDWFIKKP